jgi:hypothetical protein
LEDAGLHGKIILKWTQKVSEGKVPSVLNKWRYVHWTQSEVRVIPNVIYRKNPTQLYGKILHVQA